MLALRKIKISSILVFLTAVCFGSDSTLVPYGASWKYLDDGSDLGTVWTDSTYNDLAWLGGNAQLGYGDGDEATVVSYGPDANNKYVTTYFRNSILLSDVSLFSSYTLNVKRDDGVVVYVNSIEVFRSNLPAGVILYSTLATDASDDGNTPQTIILPAGTLINGTNTIAVEVHQASITSSDLSFDMELIAHVLAAPVLLRQPYLQMAASDAITIRWRTDIPAMSKVCYGSSPASLTNSIVDSTLKTEHELRLTSLTPQTLYYYSVGTDVDTLQGDSANFFSTSPMIGTAKPTRMWIIADSGVNTAEQNNVRDAFLNFTDSIPVDMMLMLGDNAYNTGSDIEYQDAVFQNHYENIFKHTPLWVAAGNHEMYSSDATLQTGPYYDIFSMPKNAECGGVASNTEAYYSFDYGDIHFIYLESTTASFRATGSAMLTWLDADLALTSQKWKVVYFHHPPYTKGGHDSDTEIELIDMRQNVLPIIESHKVDLVLTGHNHDYERTYFINGHYDIASTLDSSMVLDYGSGLKPAAYEKKSSANYNGTVYVSAGCSGVLSSVIAGWPHPAMFSSHDMYLGSLLLDVDADTLTLRFLDSDPLLPSVRDNFSIVKVCDIAASIDTVNEMCITGAPVTLSGFPQNGIFSGAGVSNSIFDPSLAGAGMHTINYLFTDSFGCSASATTSIKVIGQVPAQPTTITAPQNVCPPVQGVQLYITNVADAKSYSWSVSTGTQGVSIVSGQADTSVIIDIALVALPTYTMEVTANNICGASPPQQVVMNQVREIRLPVSGPAIACGSEIKTYSSPSVHAFATLTWVAPTGALINGQPSPLTLTGPTSVQVEFPANFTIGKVCVTNHPSCVSNTNISCVAVSNAPKRPSQIYGVHAVVPGTTGVPYSILPVTGATGYNWTAPPNATITSGQNTNAVIVDFSAGYTMGILSVEALSACSQSAAQRILIKSYPIPFTVENYSKSGSENDESGFVKQFVVFPNPANDKLFLRFESEENELLEISCYDLPGNLLNKQILISQKGSNKAEIAIDHLASGIYILKCIKASGNQTLHFVKE